MKSIRSLYANRLVKKFPPQVCPFQTSTRSVSSKVSLYFQRANFIDSIRLCLHSNAPESSLASILSNPSLDSFVVANALRSAPSPASALSMIETLKKVEHFSHSEQTLRALAKLLSRTGQTRRLKALIGAINAGKFRGVVHLSFMDRMRLFADAGDLEEVMRLWDEWRRESDGNPVKESYNIVMKLCIDSGRDGDAAKVFYQMVEEGMLPNCRTYTVVIHHLVKLGMVDSAMEIFRMLPRMRIKRTRKQYSTLVVAFASTNKLDVVKALLDEMHADGIFPGREMLPSLQRMKEAGYVDETEELIREMMPDERVKSVNYTIANLETDVDEEEEEEDSDSRVISGVDDSEVTLKPWLDPAALARALRDWEPEDVSVLKDANLIWTSRLVCKLIRSFKSPDTAWQFFSWVAHQPGFVHDIYTISMMITKLARHGHVQLVDHLLLKLDHEGINPSFATIRSVIDSYGFSKRGAAALKIFRSIKTICGPISETSLQILYSSLLRTLVKSKMNSEAMDIVEEMILSGTCPDLQTFTELLHHYALVGDIKTVQRLFGMVQQSNMEPDGYMYKIVIRAYCKCERASLALRILEDMRGWGLMPDAHTKALLLKSLWKEGKLREAARVEEMGEESGDNTPSLGHLNTVTAADLARVCRIYSSGVNVGVPTRERIEA